MNYTKQNRPETGPVLCPGDTTIKRQVPVLTEVTLQWGRRTRNRLTNDIRCYEEKRSKMKGDSDGSCQKSRPRKGTVAVMRYRDLNEVRELAMQRSGKGHFKQEEWQV